MPEHRDADDNVADAAARKPDRPHPGGRRPAAGTLALAPVLLPAYTPAGLMGARLIRRVALGLVAVIAVASLTL